jgi:cytochrome c biogenesis protein CcdA
VLKLAIAVAAIALPDSINPTLIGGELLVAAGRHPRWRTAMFTIAAWTVTFVFGLAFALGLGDLILSVVPKPGPRVKYTLIAVAGLALVLGGAIVWWRRKHLAKPRASGQPQLPGAAGSSGSAGLIGAGIAGVELVTAFPYFAAIAMIVGSGVSGPEKLALLVLYCVIYTLPLIAIAVVVGVMGERAERMLEPAGAWLLAHWPLIVGPLTGAFGVGVLVYGVIELSST